MDKLKCEVKLELLRLASSVQESTQFAEVQLQCKKTKTAFDILLGEEKESSETTCETEINQYFAEKVHSYQGHGWTLCIGR